MWKIDPPTRIDPCLQTKDWNRIHRGSLGQFSGIFFIIIVDPANFDTDSLSKVLDPNPDLDPT